MLALWPFAITFVIFATYHAVTTSLGLIDNPAGLHRPLLKTAGLLVDELHAVPEFGADEVIPAPFGGAARRLIEHLIRARGGDLLIAVLDTQRLFAALRKTEGVPSGA